MPINLQGAALHFWNPLSQLDIAEDMKRLSDWEPVSEAAEAKIAKGFTPEFRRWLKGHGYGDCTFADKTRPAFGGKKEGTGYPVVLVHGNSDSAEGWSKLIPSLEKQGFRVYALSVGDMDKSKALQQWDSPECVREVRNFIEAVTRYTGQKKVDVIAHSLGNLWVQKALLELKDDGVQPVRKYIAEAGPNAGLSSALGSSLWWFGCNLLVSKYFPNLSAMDPLRPFFQRVRREGIPADQVVSVYGTGDGILRDDAFVTGVVPKDDFTIQYNGKGHFQTRDLSGKHVADILKTNLKRDR